MKSNPRKLAYGPAQALTDSSERRGEQVIDAFQQADQLDLEPRQVVGDDEAFNKQAEKLRAHGRDLLVPSEPVVMSVGREAISWDNKIGEAQVGETAWIIDTLDKHPHAIAVGASGKRTAALHRVDILEPALDAAESVQAANTIEKMLAHQMTGAHFTAMRLLEASAQPNVPPVEMARLTNAAARMMDVYQSGCLTLQKLKTQGTQRVIVEYQQVNVATGGQAVVAGRVGPGSRIKGGRGGQNA